MSSVCGKISRIKLKNFSAMFESGKGEIDMDAWNIVGVVCGILGVLASFTTLFVIPFIRKSKSKVGNKLISVVYDATPPAIPPVGSGLTKPYVIAAITVENKMLADALITKVVLVDKERDKRITIIDNEKGVFEWTIKSKTKRTQKFLFCVPPPQYLLPAQCVLELTINETVLSVVVETNSKELPY